MAETTKEQAKNSEIRRKNTEQTLESEKGITSEKKKQKDVIEENFNTEKSFADLLEERFKKDHKNNLQLFDDNAKKLQQLRAEKDEEIKKAILGDKAANDRVKAIDEEIAERRRESDIAENIINKEQTRIDLLEAAGGAIDEAGNLGKKAGDAIEGFVNKLPGGKQLAEGLGIDDLGNKVKTNLMNDLMEIDPKTGKLGMSFKGLKGLFGGIGKNALKVGKAFRVVAVANPFAAVVAAGLAAFKIIKEIRKAARDLGEDLGASTSQSMKLLVPLKVQERKFKTLGLDATKIKTTLGTIADEFGNLENVTAANAANVEKMAQNLGVTGTEVVKFNKVMTDLTGMTFDQATATAQAAANLAKQENVATGKVLKDISTSAKDFARFSMDGAKGLAEAAVAAAKVGSSLSEVVKAADSLLNFEDSITKQFEAQVLTGRQINTERARQLALDGDIAGLTSEIQSIVGQVGDIQSLNVIQRKSVADAIGISVDDLLKISRGEAAQATATVQDKLDITNKLLAQQLGVNEEQLENMGKPVEMSGGII